MDDPNKKKQDAHFVSWQDYEIQYVVDTVAKANPGLDRKEIRVAIEACKREIEPSEGREKLMECVRKRLGITLPPGHGNRPPDRPKPGPGRQVG